MVPFGLKRHRHILRLSAIVGGCRQNEQRKEQTNPSIHSTMAAGFSILNPLPTQYKSHLTQAIWSRIEPSLWTTIREPGTQQTLACSGFLVAKETHWIDPSSNKAKKLLTTARYKENIAGDEECKTVGVLLWVASVIEAAQQTEVGCAHHSKHHYTTW
jgi:hypothetical protein